MGENFLEKEKLPNYSFLLDSFFFWQLPSTRKFIDQIIRRIGGPRHEKELYEVSVYKFFGQRP